jgi:hypothetical protein
MHRAKQNNTNKNNKDNNTTPIFIGINKTKNTDAARRKQRKKR